MIAAEFDADLGSRLVKIGQCSIGSRKQSFHEFLILAWIGVFLCIVFLFDIYLPRNVCIVFISLLTIWGVITVRADRHSLLQRLVIVIYSLPFAVTLGYLVDTNYLWAVTPARLALIYNDRIILQMLAIGLVGLTGLLTGMKFGEFVIGGRLPAAQGTGPLAINSKQLSIPGIAAFSILYLGLVWSGTGATANIFVQAYAGSSGVAESINFNAAILLANIVLLMLYVDAEKSVESKRNLRLRYVVCLAFIAICFELSRGNRDSLGMVVAIMALYVTGDHTSHFNLTGFRNWSRARRIAVPALFVVAIFVSLVALRVLAAGSGAISDSTDLVRLIFLDNTWTGALHSNLGLADLYASGNMKYLMGETYVDYLLSLPPGFLTQLFDISRPIESDRGPAWWFMGITAGGIHAVIVPFRNFGIVGAFVVLALIGWLISWLDAPNRSELRRFVYAVAVAASFKWLWYGDMTVFRAAMGAVLIWLLYLVAATRVWTR